MTELQELAQELQMKENEVLIFQPIEEVYHPIAWLESIGQFLGSEISTAFEVSCNGKMSVHQEINN